MTGAFLRLRSNLSEGDLRVCDKTIPVFDGKLRFNLVLEPKQQTRVEHKTPNSYSGLAAVCGVKFIPVSGFRPGDFRTVMRSRSGSHLCRARTFTYLIAFPYPRLSGLVRRRCFRSEWNTDEADERRWSNKLAEVGHRCRGCWLLAPSGHSCRGQLAASLGILMKRALVCAEIPQARALQSLMAFF
jgi:hypothetical protein